jgi:cyclopropane fatty-acyl-phospholipid synthase-like methyltransferase
MSEGKESRAARFFDELYAANPDPWGFETSDYEREKYDATLALLGNERFVSAFEVGCSIGVLTERLAEQCGKLLAVDLAGAALAQAQIRCATLAHVRFDLLRVPAEWPDEKFDLIVLSEVLYFLSPADVRSVAARVRETLRPDGRVLLVNFLGEIQEACGGDEAAEIFIAAAEMPVVRGMRAEKYRIDLLQGLSNVSTT